MKIEFLPINFASVFDCMTLAKWYNDPQINYLISPNFHQGPMAKMTPEHISKVNIHPKFEKYAYFIVCDGKIVGDINIIDNPDYLLVRSINTSWLGITIGEREYQGLGIGNKSMEFIENFAKENGFKRMELGVFSFNKKAIEFYKKRGYKQFGVVPKFTFYNGSWYDDLRFEKYL